MSVLLILLLKAQLPPLARVHVGMHQIRELLGLGGVAASDVEQRRLQLGEVLVD